MPLPVFGTSVRDNNNCGNSFIGTRYFQKYPAPGRYETGRTTLNTTPLSRSRTSDWTRRYRNTRSMEGTQAMLSLGGADRVGEKVGPAPGTYEAPPDSFARAMSRRNTWTAAFAGRTSRLPPPRDANGTYLPRYGVREKRSVRRTLPPRKKKWTDTRPRTAAAPLPYEPPVLDNIEDEEDMAYDFFAAPTRRPPALADFTLSREKVHPRERPVTASEIIQHRRATDDFKDDLRAVTALNKFKVPKSRTSIVAI
jgi:hypothetical protein